MRITYMIIPTNDCLIKSSACKNGA